MTWWLRCALRGLAYIVGAELVGVVAVIVWSAL